MMVYFVTKSLMEMSVFVSITGCMVDSVDAAVKLISPPKKAHLIRIVHILSSH